MQEKKCFSCENLMPISEFGFRLKGEVISKNCKRCVNARRINWCKSKKGLLFTMYRGQKNSSIKRGHGLPAYSLGEFRYWAFNLTDFNLIYENWVNNDYYKWLRPSCDRIEDYLGYSFDNILMTTWKINLEKYHNDARSGKNKKCWTPIVKLSMDGEFIIKYDSVKIASEICGSDNSLIVKCCRDKRKSAGGFKWMYKSDYDKLNK